MILNPYRFGADITTPTHWWNLNNNDAIDSGDGCYDLGSKSPRGGGSADWDLTATAGVVDSAGGGPNGQDCIDMSQAAYIETDTDQVWDSTSQTFSIACWALADAFPATGNWLMSWRGGAAPEPLFYQLLMWALSSPEEVQGCAYDEDRSGGCTSGASAVVTTSTWYHIAMTWDGTTLRIYQDGTEIDTATLTILDLETTDAMPFALGISSWAKASSSNGHDGKMMSVGIWDVELSATAVQDLYNGGKSGAATDGYYADYTWI